jgi:membrane-associated phospholipid phosphatase
MGNHQSNGTEAKSSKVSAGRFGILVVSGLLVCLSSFFWDSAVIEWVNTHDWEPLKKLAGFLSRWGDWPELMLYGGIGLGWAWTTRNRDLFKILLCMMFASTVAGAVVNSIRLTSGRARPNNTEATYEWNGLWRDGEFLLSKNKYHSFPSGHSGAAFAFFGLPLFADRRNWWLVLMAAGIAWSRIYLNVHHLSDVLVGAFIGIFVAAIVWDRFGPIAGRLVGRSKTE